MTSLREDYDDEDDNEGAGSTRGTSLGIEETRDILICYLFVLEHIEHSTLVMGHAHSQFEATPTIHIHA